jgi:hypothetical protein
MKTENPTGIAPYVQILLTTIVLLALIIACEFIFAPKAYSQSAKVKARQNYNADHPTFSKGDTVLDVKPNLLFTIVAPEYRPDKKQPFYIGVSLSHNDTVKWIPENSIRKVSLILVDKMGPYIK